MQNLNFVLDKKKKRAWFAKKISFKNHVLGMKFKVTFLKCAFGKKHGKGMSSQTNPKYRSRMPL
jgi:hypothetical protein